MSGHIEQFKQWYESLSVEQRASLMPYLRKILPSSDIETKGFFSGPSGTTGVMSGVFTGSSSMPRRKVCPTCKR